jgi:hypothetical protein
MMAIVYLGYKISDGQLQLVRPQTPGLAFGAKTNARPEVMQDVRRLRDHQATGLQKRWCVWGAAAAVHQVQHCIYTIAASRQSCNIAVPGARRLERKPYELATPLYAGPVIQVLLHVHPPPFQTKNAPFQSPRGNFRRPLTAISCKTTLQLGLLGQNEVLTSFLQSASGMANAQPAAGNCIEVSVRNVRIRYI